MTIHTVQLNAANDTGAPGAADTQTIPLTGGYVLATCFLSQVTQQPIIQGDLEGWGRGEVSVIISSYTTQDNPTPQECQLQHLHGHHLTSVTFTLTCVGAIARAMGVVYPDVAPG
jgi:hypothetical protein